MKILINCTAIKTQHTAITEAETDGSVRVRKIKSRCTQAACDEVYGCHGRADGATLGIPSRSPMRKRVRSSISFVSLAWLTHSMAKFKAVSSSPGSASRWFSDCVLWVAVNGIYGKNAHVTSLAASLDIFVHCYK